MFSFASRQYIFTCALCLALFACSLQLAHAQPPPASRQHPGVQPQSPLPPALQKISDMYATAVKLHSAKKYPEALAAYELYLRMAIQEKAAPGAILPAYSNMAMIYQTTNDKPHYAEMLHKIVGMDPNNSRALAQLAIIESTSHHYDLAASYCNRALALKPSADIASSVHFIKGNIAVAHKNYAAAEKEFGESTRLTPANALAHFNYGLALGELKRYDEAMKQLETAHHQDPGNARIKEYLGKLTDYIAVAKGRPLGTPKTQFDDALKKDPHNGPALLGKAMLLEQMGRNGDAVSLYLSAIVVMPDSYEAHFHVAHLYELERNFTPSKDHYQKAHLIADKARIKVKDENERAKIVGMDAKALSGCASAELAEGLSLGDYRQRIQAFTAADGHVKQAIQLLPKDMDIKARLGRIYEAQSKFKEAADLYREILTVTPDSVPIYTRLSMTYKSRADVGGFVQVWKEYQAHKPTDPTSYEYIADIYNQSAKYELAIESLRGMLTHKLANSVIASARVVIGQDLNMLKKADEARAEYKAVLALTPSKLPEQFMLQERAALDAEQLTALKGLASLASSDNKLDDSIGWLTELKKREGEIAKQNQRLPDGEVYKDIALLYERAKKPDMAIKEYRAMAAVRPADPVPHEEIGRLLEGEKKLDDAAAEYKHASELNVNDPVLDQLKIAQMYQSNHMLDKAIVALETLYKKNLKNVEIMTTLAQVYRQSKQDEKALGIYNAMVKVNPGLTWVQDRRAESFVNLKRYPEAEAVYVQEIDRNPTSSRETYDSLARVYALEGRADKFLDLMKARFEKAPANFVAMGVVYDEFKRQNKELEGQNYILGVIIKLAANRRGGLEAYANILQIHNHKPESLDIYRTIAKENPKDLTAWTNLAEQLDYNDKPDEANQIFIDQMARRDLLPNQMAFLQRNLAMRYFKQNKFKESRAAFQKIFEADKRDYDAAMRLGDLIERTGSAEEAIAFYQSLLKLPPYPIIALIDIHNRSANLYTHINKKDEAVKEYNETLKLDKENPIALAALKKLQSR